MSRSLIVPIETTTFVSIYIYIYISIISESRTEWCLTPNIDFINLCEKICETLTIVKIRTFKCWPLISVGEGVHVYYTVKVYLFVCNCHICCRIHL